MLGWRFSLPDRKWINGGSTPRIQMFAAPLLIIFFSYGYSWIYHSWNISVLNFLTISINSSFALCYLYCRLWSIISSSVQLSADDDTTYISVSEWRWVSADTSAWADIITCGHLWLMDFTGSFTIDGLSRSFILAKWISLNLASRWLYWWRVGPTIGRLWIRGLLK